MYITNEFSEPSILQFRAARFAYRVGYPIMSDGEYDILERQIRQKYPQAEELFQTYECDKIVPEELRAFGIDEFIIDAYARHREYKYDLKYNSSTALLDEENNSIISKKTDLEVFNYFQELGKGVYLLSPKIDGLFTSLIYERDEDGSNGYTLAASTTRGESSSRIDITSNMSNIVSTRIVLENEPEAIRIAGESIFDAEQLENTSYKTQRSACQGVIASTVNIKSEMQQYVKFFAHGSNMSGGYSDSLSKIKAAGFQTVPLHSYVFDSDNVDTMLFTLQPILNKIKLWGEKNKIIIDGVVAVKENKGPIVIKTSGNKLYKQDTFAIKIGFWNNGFFKSKVIGIIAAPQDARVSYKLDIVPVTANNGCTLTKVTDLNLATLIRDNIVVGDTVAFNYLNATTIKYLYKVVESDEIE